jgi:hypothetical protein
MINESQSDYESTTKIAKAPNSIEQVHVSASGIIKILIKFKYIIKILCYNYLAIWVVGGKSTINRAYYFSNLFIYLNF